MSVMRVVAVIVVVVSCVIGIVWQESRVRAQSWGVRLERVQRGSDAVLIVRADGTIIGVVSACR